MVDDDYCFQGRVNCYGYLRPSRMVGCYIGYLWSAEMVLTWNVAEIPYRHLLCLHTALVALDTDGLPAPKCSKANENRAWQRGTALWITLIRYVQLTWKTIFTLVSKINNWTVANRGHGSITPSIPSWCSILWHRVRPEAWMDNQIQNKNVTNNN